jgi:hypothetical protein
MPNNSVKLTLKTAIRKSPSILATKRRNRALPAAVIEYLPSLSIKKLRIWSLSPAKAKQCLLTLQLKIF